MMSLPNCQLPIGVKRRATVKALGANNVTNENIADFRLPIANWPSVLIFILFAKLFVLRCKEQERSTK